MQQQQQQQQHTAHRTKPTNNFCLTGLVYRAMASEEDEVRALLMRHRKQIIRDVNESKLITVLTQKGVFSAPHLKQLNEIQSDKIKIIGLNNGTTPIIKNLTDTTNGCANNSGFGAGETNNFHDTADVDEKKCKFIIDVIARNGFEKFKEFCYAIESECPQLIGDLINDRLNSGKFMTLYMVFDLFTQSNGMN